MINFGISLLINSTIDQNRHRNPVIVCKWSKTLTEIRRINSLPIGYDHKKNVKHNKFSFLSIHDEQPTTQKKTLASDISSHTQKHTPIPVTWWFRWRWCPGWTCGPLNHQRHHLPPTPPSWICLQLKSSRSCRGGRRRVCETPTAASASEQSQQQHTLERPVEKAERLTR